MRRVVEGVIGVPATEGNQIDVLRNGDEIFPAMLEAIEAANHTIDFLTFVYWDGEIGADFAHALAARAKDGVRVRLLLDSWGARTINAGMLALMDTAGVRIRWFRPLGRVILHMNHRTHRKVMITDESVAFTGGVGIADEWKGDARDPREWRDTHFRIRGPAVDGLRSAFLDNWLETDPELFDPDVDRFPHQPQPGDAVVQCVRGASESGLSDISTLFDTLVQSAQDCIRITTAYFAPDEGLTDRLCAAADRNVQVQILLPGPHIDKRFVQVAGEALYPRLFRHGIELWSFQPSMLHAKIMTVDGFVSNVGSANLNARSTALDEEINLVAFDARLAALLDAHFDEDLERSERIDPARWRDRSWTQRVLEAAVRPVRRWF